MPNLKRTIGINTALIVEEETLLGHVYVDYYVTFRGLRGEGAPGELETFLAANPDIKELEGTESEEEEE